ncbi:MAG: 4-hydroxy-tetrahydrodipicolinate reductase [Verrucomicrobia bacterium]|nr:4-hydroxy-tetrahydrodipicolinate reductase [Verrucomicrobiota bacterium]
MATKILVVGSKGRMGQAILALARADNSFDVVGEVDQGDDLGKAALQAQVIVDFSHRSAAAAVLKQVLAVKAAYVCGTTGHIEAEVGMITAAARQVPLIISPNFSLGVNLLFYLTEQAAKALPEGFDPEVIEIHHRLKKDAPSGTAKLLVEILAEARRTKAEVVARHGREGELGERTEDEIGVHAVRGGDVVGDHTVLLAGDGERIELTHRATTRDVFARGALRAAKWLVGKPPKLYRMVDVLGLS